MWVDGEQVVFIGRELSSFNKLDRKEMSQMFPQGKSADAFRPENDKWAKKNKFYRFF